MPVCLEQRACVRNAKLVSVHCVAVTNTDTRNETVWPHSHRLPMSRTGEAQFRSRAKTETLTMRLLNLSTRPIPILCVLALILFVTQERAVGAEASYFTFQVPGALGTYPLSVNASMAVTGYYTTSPSTAAGFVRSADGTISTFSIDGGLWTEPESINDLGDVTGFYEVVASSPQGFIRYANGRIVTFDPPAGEAGRQAQPVAINEFDEVAGNYPFPNVAANGFARSRAGAFATFDFALGVANSTDVTGLNASGTIVGYVSPGGSNRNGFFRDPSGFSVQFGVPVLDGDSQLSNEVTVPEGINETGTIAGWYSACFNRCSTTIAGGFVRSPQGIFTVFNPPGTIVTLPELGLEFEGNESLTAPHRLSISDDGTITGSYTDINGIHHGFVRNPSGTITSFDPPRGTQTTATSINDSGVIAGSFYYDFNFETSIGFLRIPTQ